MDQKFKDLLNATYQWPADYPFKFIVKRDAVKDFLKLFPELLVHEEKPSANGKYVSVGFHLRLNAAEEVWNIYERAKKFPGVISL